MTREEEQILIKKAQAGDADAFEPLVLENQTKVYNLALRMMGNPTDAEDAAQEAFIKAWNSLKDFRGDSRFSVWLYRLTNNVCIDMLRKQKRTSAVSLTQEDDEGEELELTIPDERLSPEEELEKKELREQVQTALQALPEEWRSILVMRELGGLSYEELAAELNLEPGTVKSRLNRARKKLCAELINSGNFSAPVPSKIGKGV